MVESIINKNENKPKVSVDLNESSYDICSDMRKTSSFKNSIEETKPTIQTQEIKKISFLCINIEKVLYNSIKIPLLEILKSLLNENLIYSIVNDYSTISINENSDLFSYFRDKSNKDENIFIDKKLNTFHSIYLVTLIVLINLLFNIVYDDKSLYNLFILSCLFILLLLIIITSNRKIKFNTKEIKPSNTSILKSSVLINVNAKDVYKVLSNNTSINEFLKNLTSFSSSEGIMKYNFSDQNNVNFELKVKRLGMKRNKFYIIAEFIEEDLFKMILIESPVINNNISEETDYSYCKVSVFLNLSLYGKYSIPNFIFFNQISFTNKLYSHFSTKNMELSSYFNNNKTKFEQKGLELDKYI